jgi:cbb3-type cytochrome c oxidase subunit III
MTRGWKKADVVIILAGFVVMAGTVWLLTRTPKVLDVMGISNLQFHQDLHEVGFDGPKASGSVQRLAWNRPVHDEAGVADLARSLDLRPATLAAEPHADMVSIQSSLHVSVPVLNSILGWSSASTDVWVLRQRYMARGAPWLTYAIVQDKTVTPNRAFYLGIGPARVVFAGNDCFGCHASGPRVLRPIRPDLLVGAEIAAAFNDRIAANGYVETHFAAADPAPPAGPGPALTASACVGCHKIGGERGPLYHRHDDSIRALVATGAMPREGHLSPAQAAEVEAWLAANRD